MPDYATARLNMVEGQVKPNRVTDIGLLNAMANVPRELFVPDSVRGIAYVDDDLPIGGGRHLMEPMVFGRLVTEARIGPGDRVLDLGCATGYSTAVLARVAGMVVAVESDPALAARAAALLADLGVGNAVVTAAPLTGGAPDRAPYRAILVNGAVAAVPPALAAQLADGGRLVAVVSPRGRMGKATLFERIGDTVSSRELFDAAVPLLPGFEPRAGFEF